MSVVILVNGLLLVFMASLLGINATFFPSSRAEFATAAVAIGLLGLGMAVSVRGRKDDLRRPHTFLLTTSIWITAGLAGAVPLFIWGLPVTDAVFEAVSGITTTGSTVMSGLDTTDRGVLFWRALLQWIGGVGFIVTGMALLPVLKVGGMQLYRTESSDRGEKELASATQVAAGTAQVYVALSLACAILYMLGGMNGFDAFTHAMTTLSTGGYSNYDASFGHFESPFLQWNATVFMLLGALPFAWYIRAMTKGRFSSEQVGRFLLGIGVVVGLLTFWRILDHGADPLVALREVAFNVVSVVTTTGYATTDYTLWGTAAVVAFFFLTAVGGCTGSTSGASKMMRWIILTRSIRAQMRQVYLPHAVERLSYEGKAVDEDVLNGVIAFFGFFAATVFGLGFLLTLVGLDAGTALSGALTAVANVGPGIGPIIGPAGNFGTLPDEAKWLLTFGMLVGRLEMLTVYVLVTRTFWESARS